MSVAVKKFADSLNPSFVARMSKQQVPWGPLGYVTYKRTYARLREDLGRTEEWADTVERCVNAILKYGGRFTGEEAEQAFEYIYTLKCVPPGRMLWQLGTSTVDKIGGDSLCNCWMTAVDTIDSFCFAFDELMLGGGVGFSIMPSHVYKLPSVKAGVTIIRRDGNDVDFIVPDNREGWVELLRRTLNAYFVTGRGFSYSTHCVRSKGERIKGFGGVASGPQDLVKGINQITTVLAQREGKSLRPVDALDIMNIIGSVVVSGNVRRSAQLALGAADDFEFLTAKQWAKGIPNWRAMSNNSVAKSKFSELPDEFWMGYRGEGEPYGLINLDSMRAYGRLRDGKGYRPDKKVIGVNPCQPADALLLTPNGLRTMGSLSAGDTIWSEDGWVKIKKKWSTGVKDVYRYRTTAGVVYATENHRILQDGVKVELAEAEAIDSLQGEFFGGEAFDPQAVMDGLYFGDGAGTYKGKEVLFIGEKDSCYLNSEVAHLIKEKFDGYGPTAWKIKSTLTAENLGLTHQKRVPMVYMQADRKTVAAFLRGLYSANGSVVAGRVTLKTSSAGLAEDVQVLLSSLGIASYYTTNKQHDVDFPNGKYTCKESYDVNITTDRVKFAQLIGFIHPYKTEKLMLTLATGKGRVKKTYEILSVDYRSTEEVFDIEVDGRHHTYWHCGHNISNCAEQTLEDKECCDLFELFLPRFKDRKEFVTAAKIGYKFCKTVMQLPFSWAETQAVVTRNQRLGISVSGFCQSDFDAEDYNAVYGEIEQLDERYSKRIKAEESIKLTTVKPSGTVSLLAGVTPGVHPAYSRYYIRRIRFSANDPIVDACRKAGYPVEPQYGFDGTADHDTQVVSFPVDVGPKTLTAAQVSAVDQLEKQKFLQTHWSDNAVSVTVYYRDEELPAIKDWLKTNYSDAVKTVSFLRHSEHGFKQAPYEEIGAKGYAELASKVKPLTKLNEQTQWDLIDSGECAGGACPVK